MTENHGVLAPNKSAPARYGFLRRDAVNQDDIIWVTVPAHFVLHFVNAYQEDENTVVVFGCCFDDLNLDIVQEYPEFAGSNMRRLEFNLKTKQCQIKELLTGTEYPQDLPTINPRYQGKKARYGYLMKLPKVGSITDPNIKKDMWSSGYFKYDLIDQKIVADITYGHHCFGGEAFFAPRTNAKSEDDGYVMNIVYDGT